MESIDIGWCFITELSSSIYFSPENLNIFKNKESTTSEGVSACPAVQSIKKNVFMIKSPFSIRLRIIKSSFENKYDIRPVYPDTEINQELLPEIVNIEPKTLWINKEKPIIQIKLPYIFFSDEQVELFQLETPHCRSQKNWSLIQGMFDIYSWQRTINFAFQWSDVKNDLYIKRGDPIFQILFQTNNPVSNFRLRKTKMHDDLKNRINECEGITGYIKGTSKVIKNSRTENIRLVL